MTTKITVIIPNWNGKKLLKQCLKSLECQTFKDFQVFLVDNASEDGSVKMVTRIFPNVRIYRLANNIGFGQAVNFGIKNSESPYLMLLNNDIECEASCLDKIYQHLQNENDNCGGVQCRMMNYFERDVIDSLGVQIRKGKFYDIAHGKKFSHKYKKQGHILGLCAGASLYRRKFFEDVGLFDRNFFAGFEDVDISLRGVRKGWYFKYEPQAVVFHHKSFTFNKLSYNKHLELRKNYYLLGYKNFPKTYLPSLTLNLLNHLQKDFFNVIKLLRKKRHRNVVSMYQKLFSNVLTSVSKRKYAIIKDSELERLFLLSQECEIWRQSILNRSKVIQEFINYKKYKTYLEIGVLEGETFLNICSRRKIAVDPYIKISIRKKIASIRRCYLNIFSRYFEMSSDEFFKSKTKLLEKYGLDIILIDGLHTYTQSLIDTKNCLKYLNKDGVIVMHDCNPPSESAAYPANSIEEATSLNLPGWDGEWCGDVWKTIIYLRSIQRNLNVFVLDCDFGLGIITKGEPESIIEYSKEEIDDLTYQELEKYREKILNLKSTEYLKAFLQKY